MRVVDRLEKRYEEPGLNLTHDVREGILKHTAWKRDFPFPLDFREGLRFESGGTLEAQLVNWSDEIAQQTHDLEDGLPLTEEDAIEELAIARRVRAARGLRQRPPTSRARVAHPRHDRRSCRPTSSRARAPASSAWLEANADRDDRTTSTRGATALPGDLVGFTETGQRLYRS